MRFLNVVMSLVFALGLLGCANSSQSADGASGNTPSGRNVFLVDQDHKTLLSLGEPSVLLGGSRKIGVVLLHTILMSLLFLGNLAAPLLLFRFRGRANAVFSPRLIRMEFLSRVRCPIVVMRVLPL